MSDYAEEQRNEIEALESIYPSEFEIIADEPCPKFSISLKTEDYIEGEEAGATCTLVFTYVPTYPDEVPVVEIENFENIEEEDVNELLDKLNTEAKENVGMVMIFTLVSIGLEWLNVKVEEIVEKRQQEVEKKEREKEEAEIIRFEGTRVTVETFLKWKAEFDEEMALLKKRLQKEEIASKKLTGRELFERDHTLNESDINFMQDGEEEITVDESLFQELDDMDLNDLQDEDIDDD